MLLVRFYSSGTYATNYFLCQNDKENRTPRRKYFNTSEGVVHKYRDVNDILAEIVGSFPAEGLPTRFTLDEQSTIMINYHKQKSELYETVNK